MAERLKSHGYSISQTEAMIISNHARRMSESLGFEEVSESLALRNILRYFSMIVERFPENVRLGTLPDNSGGIEPAKVDEIKDRVCEAE